MPSVTIKIQRKNCQDKILPELPVDRTVMAKLKTFCILEGGMVNGKSSVSFHIVLPTGHHALAETSGEIFKSMAAALQGAEQNWLENPLDTSAKIVTQLIASDGVTDHINKVSEAYELLKDNLTHLLADLHPAPWAENINTQIEDVHENIRILRDLAAANPRAQEPDASNIPKRPTAPDPEPKKYY